MYGQEQSGREMILEQYRGDVERLLPFLPWLHKAAGTEVQSYYEGDGEQQIMRIPVYDATLLSVVKEVEKTKLVTKNYPYIYSRYRIVTPEDERRLLKEARIQDMDLFCAIISKYVLEGKRRGAVWSDAIREQIFTTALDALNELFFRYAP